MLELDSKFYVELEYSIQYETESLYLCYAPLMGNDSVALYQTLYTIYQLQLDINVHEELINFINFSLERIYELRIKLEQFLLLDTYYKETHKAYVYVLKKPLSLQRFLAHDVLGRMYLKKMKEQIYEKMKISSASNSRINEDYKKITSSMKHMLIDWDKEEENCFERQCPTIDKVEYDFNIHKFLNQMSNMVFPVKDRTKENLDFIAEKASIYGLNEKEMRKIVGDSMDFYTNSFSKKILMKKLKNYHKAIKTVIQDPYQLSPILFLQSKQNGLPVAESDKYLIDNILINKYHLNLQVINVLLEYVLQRCNQVLKKSYVEKVASSWVRLKIDSKEKALAQINLENAKKKNIAFQPNKQLPEWYRDQSKIQTKKREFKEEDLLLNLKKLGE